jgi:hypothetical protein
MPSNPAPTRRAVLRTLVAALTVRTALPADFWLKKPATEWSDDELHQILNKSPWAKKVIGDLPGANNLAAGADAGAAGSGIRPARASNAAALGDGGVVGGEAGGRGGAEAPATAGGRSRGPAVAPEVVVRWDSAKPVLAALKAQLPKELDGHYALSIIGLPPQFIAMGFNSSSSATTDPAARQKALVDTLLRGATLSAKGRDPQNADLVLQSADQHALIFGFSRQALPLTAMDRAVLFTLKLGQLTVKARFEPKEMLFDGQLAM